MDMEILKYILAIISGLTACIPLVIQLVKYVEKATKEKNWDDLVKMVMNYMEVAETKFDDGATRKEWVMAMIVTSASTINYEIDMQAVSELVDNLAALSKVVNAPNETSDQIEVPKSDALSVKAE